MSRSSWCRQLPFVNPHGLDHPDHYSTAFGLAMITRVAMLCPQFSQTVNKMHHDASFDGSIGRLNTNRLLVSFVEAEVSRPAPESRLLPSGSRCRTVGA